MLRAFTTAACAFDRGATEIILVSTVEEAFEQRQLDAGCLLAGEVNGLPIDGFDLPNSPSAIKNLDLLGRRLVLRTTAGTQGAVLAARARHLFVASLNVATATAVNVTALNPDRVTFVETGVRVKGGGEEDSACADYIASLLLGSPLRITDIQNRVISSRAGARFLHSGNNIFPHADLEHALKVDCFQFAMKVTRAGGLLLLRPMAV